MSDEPVPSNPRRHMLGQREANLFLVGDVTLTNLLQTVCCSRILTCKVPVQVLSNMLNRLVSLQGGCSCSSGFNLVTEGSIPDPIPVQSSPPYDGGASAFSHVTYHTLTDAIVDQDKLSRHVQQNRMVSSMMSVRVQS